MFADVEAAPYRGEVAVLVPSVVQAELVRLAEAAGMWRVGIGLEVRDGPRKAEHHRRVVGPDAGRQAEIVVGQHVRYERE